MKKSSGKIVAFAQSQSRTTSASSPFKNHRTCGLRIKRIAIVGSAWENLRRKAKAYQILYRVKNNELMLAQLDTDRLHLSTTCTLMTMRCTVNTTALLKSRCLLAKKAQARTLLSSRNDHKNSKLSVQMTLRTLGGIVASRTYFKVF